MQRNKKPAAHYLREMAGFAKMVNAHLSLEDEADLAADKRYVRINSAGIRVISLSSDSPCGKVEGHNTVVTLSAVHRAREGVVKKAGNGKPEHRMQAALIEHAKRWPAVLPELLCLSDQCDELRFVKDELAVDFMTAEGVTKSIRPDVILVGKKGHVWFPVFIELKARREKDTLLKQLADAADALTSDPEACEAFVGFVRAAARLNTPERINEPIDVSRSIRLMIWPKNPGTEQFYDFGSRTFAVEFNPADAVDRPEHYDRPVLRFTPVRRPRTPLYA